MPFVPSHGVKYSAGRDRIAAGQPADDEHLVVVGKQEREMVLARGRERVVGRRKRVRCRGIEHFGRRELAARSGAASHQHAAIEQRRRRQT